MKKIKMLDGTPIYCMAKSEALVLDDHVKGYLKHGIALKEGAVVVDVGANIGVFGIRASKWYHKMELHCFEPVPQIYKILSKNAELSQNPFFYTYQLGLGAKQDALNFTYFPNSPALSTSNPDLWEKDPQAFIQAVKGSIHNAPDSFWWARIIPGFAIPFIAWYLRKGKKQVVCKVCSLSDVIFDKNIEVIDLLKIDCEGQEWDVLLGIEDQHWPIIKSVVMEVHDIDDRLVRVKQLLMERGFSQVTAEKEKALEQTDLVNVFALR